MYDVWHEVMREGGCGIFYLVGTYITVHITCCWCRVQGEEGGVRTHFRDVQYVFNCLKNLKLKREIVTYIVAYTYVHRSQ